jgi:Fe-S-cluster formation regulator IscX/YfhJ
MADFYELRRELDRMGDLTVSQIAEELVDLRKTVDERDGEISDLTTEVASLLDDLAKAEAAR